MISDQDRQLAEETFAYIEAGQRHQELEPCVTVEPGDWGYECWATGFGQREEHDRRACEHYDVSMALAEHTASAIDKILEA